MGESVIRFRRGRGFTTVYNSVAQDGRLSLATRGLFTLMASLPEDWDYTVSGLAAKANASRYEIRKCLEQLQTVGYLIREQGHDEGSGGEQARQAARTHPCNRLLRRNHRNRRQHRVEQISLRCPKSSFGVSS